MCVCVSVGHRQRRDGVKSLNYRMIDSYIVVQNPPGALRGKKLPPEIDRISAITRHPVVMLQTTFISSSFFMVASMGDVEIVAMC